MENATVLCIPGFTGSPRQFRGLSALLEPRFTLVAGDLAGYGLRPAWRAARLFTLADEAAAFEALLPSDGQIHLVAHSYGAAVALRMVAKHRLRVCSIAMYEPAIWGTLASLRAGHAATRQIESLRAETTRLLQAGAVEIAAECFMDYWAGAGSWALMAADRKRRVLDVMRSLPSGWQASFDDRWSAQELRSLEIPCLLLTGRESTAPARAAVALLRDTLPCAQLVEFECLGHLGPITHPERIDTAVAAFIFERSQPWPLSCPSRTA